MLFKCWIRKEINLAIGGQHRAQYKKMDFELQWKVVTKAGKIIKNTVCWNVFFFSAHNAFISRFFVWMGSQLADPGWEQISVSELLMSYSFHSALFMMCNWSAKIMVSLLFLL